MNVLDLFSGIGGFSLGLEATGGFETVAFCEIEEYPRAVLRKHWPSVMQFTDVRQLNVHGLALRGVTKPDVICGGFPCQDISLAGKGAGITGHRSGLWSEYRRLIEEIRPRWAIIENVSALRSRGLAEVLRSLAEIGYDAEWNCIPAAAVGAPHRRDRIWIVAYPGCERGAGRREAGDVAGTTRDCQADSEERKRHGNAADHSGAVVADAYEPRLQRWLGKIMRQRASEQFARQSGSSMADTESNGRNAWRKSDAAQIEGGRQSDRSGCRKDVADATMRSDEQRSARSHVGGFQKEILREGWYSHDWNIEPDVGRVANGIPARIHRLRCLGNSIVPQIAEIIGQAILAYETHNVRT